MGFLICLDLVSSNGLCTVTFIYDSKGVLNRELLQFRILGGGGGINNQLNCWLYFPKIREFSSGMTKDAIA